MSSYKENTILAKDITLTDAKRQYDTEAKICCLTAALLHTFLSTAQMSLPGIPLAKSISCLVVRGQN